MKSMWPPLAAIFFMTSFTGPGGVGPLGPPGSATVNLLSLNVELKAFTDTGCERTLTMHFTRSPASGLEKTSLYDNHYMT